jgi:hypothetical protein
MSMRNSVRDCAWPRRPTVAPTEPYGTRDASWEVEWPQKGQIMLDIIRLVKHFWMRLGLNADERFGEFSCEVSHQGDTPPSGRTLLSEPF